MLTDADRTLLAQRAARLARPLSLEEPTEKIDLVLLEAGRELFAIEPRYVLKVLADAAITPVPGVPPEFLGVVSSGGEVLPVVDVLALLGTGRLAGPPAMLVVVGEQRGEIALGVDRAELGTVTPWVEAAGDPLVRGTIMGRRTVLAGEALLRDPRLWLAESKLGLEDAADDR